MSAKNRFDEFFTFRIANENDIDSIMEFIKVYWDERHILANNREFFEYFFCFPKGVVNIFLMLDKKGNIVGMNGLVPYARKAGKLYCGSCILKVKPDLKPAMAGIELMKRCADYIMPSSYANSGVNPSTAAPIFKKIFGYDTGIMDIYYMTNPYLKEFRLIKALTGHSFDYQEALVQYNFVKVESMEQLNFDYEKEYPSLPYKGLTYLKHRYEEHPIFKYDNYAVFNGDICEGVIFMRQQRYEGSSLIFIVDFVGNIDVFSHIHKGLIDVLAESGAECIHFMQCGISKELLDRGGFLKVNLDSDKVIIPTYFDPFVKQNIKNYYFRENPEEIIFKGAGDQDNPRRSI